MSDHAPIGRHMLVTLRGCPPALLDDELALRSLTHAAATATGASVLSVSTQHFTPYGVTSIALLAESHAALHTYPEHGLAYWDCFTCGSDCDPARSVPTLIAALQPTEVEHELVLRGGAVPPERIPQPASDRATHLGTN